MDYQIKNLDLDKENTFQDVAFDFYSYYMALCGTNGIIKIYKNDENFTYKFFTSWEVYIL